MGDFDLTYVDDSMDKATSAGIVLNPGGTINTKPATYTELIASTAGDAVMMQVAIASDSNVSSTTQALIDIAVGAASSEVNILDNIKYYSDDSQLANLYMFYIYIPIASGSRISARMQASTTTALAVISVTLFSSNFTVSSSVTTYGADTSTSRGSLIPDPGGTANTLPATWTEITSSLSHDINYIILCFGNNNNGGSANAEFLYQLGTGAASSEVVAVDGIIVRSSSAEHIGPVFLVVPIVASSGTRIAIRCQSNSTNSLDRLLDIVAIAVESDITAAGGGGGGIAQIVGSGGIVG